MIKEIMQKLKWKKKVYRMRRSSHWGRIQKSCRACSDATRKAKAQELSLVRELKDNRKGLLKHINGKKKNRENEDLSEVGTLARENSEKAELLNTFFASIFTEVTVPWKS